MKVYSVNNMMLKQQQQQPSVQQQQQQQQPQPQTCPVMHQPQPQVVNTDEPTVEYERPKRVLTTEGSQVYFARQNGSYDERTL
jgi:hypothetical protein